MINVISGLASTSSALNAERTRLEVIAQNIANANTTRGPNGQPYQRQEVVFQTLMNQKINDGSSASAQPVNIGRIQSDNRPARLLYNPGHPDADPATGMVATPDINIHEEMADMMTASRAFEANLAVFKNSRALAVQSLSIGKG
jgi:flagellar basal-body rod protein FlgC